MCIEDGGGFRVARYIALAMNFKVRGLIFALAMWSNFVAKKW